MVFFYFSVEQVAVDCTYTQAIFTFNKRLGRNIDFIKQFIKHKTMLWIILFSH